MWLPLAILHIISFAHKAATLAQLVEQLICNQ